MTIFVKDAGVWHEIPVEDIAAEIKELEAQLAALKARR